MPWISQHPYFFDMVKSTQVLRPYFDPFLLGSTTAVLRANPLSTTGRPDMIESQQDLRSTTTPESARQDRLSTTTPDTIRQGAEPTAMIRSTQSPSSRGGGIMSGGGAESRSDGGSPSFRKSRSVRSSSTPSSISPAVATPGAVSSSPDRVVQPLQVQSPNTPNQQLPPSCGAKQLSKLKRFLTTLQKFGSDISPEVGAKVRNLVRALVNSQLSIEDFHSNLQETTNFPLKPFVIPFLKAALPLLQEELLHCAQISRLSPHQYLAKNEKLVFDTSSADDAVGQPLLSPPIPPQKLITTETATTVTSAVIGANKRKNPNPTSLTDGPAPKRPIPASHPIAPSLLLDRKLIGSNTSGDFSLSTLDRPFITANNRNSVTLPSPSPIRLDDISRLSHSRLETTLSAALDSNRLFGQHARSTLIPDVESSTTDRAVGADSWEQINAMLTCITNMVDKTKTALTNLRDIKVRETHELALLMRRQAEGIDLDLKKRTGEMMTQTLRQTEDKIADIKQKADEMVSDMKRQALIEIQSAVTAAELKANELIGQEKAKMEQSLKKIRQSARDEAMQSINSQIESQETCWNCGRTASETCSGCNKARYCGLFCQHKDWDRHHTACGSIKVGGGSSHSDSDEEHRNGSGEKETTGGSEKCGTPVSQKSDSNNNSSSNLSCNTNTSRISPELKPKLSPK